MDEKEKPKDASNEVFDEKWMNQCYKNVAYPEPACVKVMEQVSRALAKRVTQPQESELKQQALFTLLGPQFTEQYFPYQKYNVKILDPPKIKPAQKEKYVEEMRVFLNKSLDLAMKDLGYPEDVSHYKGDNELGQFVQNIKSSFKEGLRKHTAQTEQKEEMEKENRKKEKKDKSKKTKTDDNDSDDGDAEDSDDDDNDNPRKKTHKLNSTRSDICSRAMLAIITQDPSKKGKYLKGIKERHLGFNMTLRRHLWRDYLGQKEKAKLNMKEEEEDIIPGIRQNFAKNLTKEMKAQNLSRAIQSNSWKAIDHAVIETYDYTKSLRPLDTDEHMIQTARTLNILCVYTKQFSVSSIHWLMPLQQVYKTRPGDKEDIHVTKLAVYLDLMLRHCQPSIQDVFKLADAIVDTVKQNDPDYYSHINRCLSTQVSRITLRDFPAEVLLIDQTTSLKLYTELKKSGTTQLNPEHQKIFTDPDIFVRMWLIQGYVGVLSIAASMWVWDELFLNKWSHKYLTDVGVAVLSLIKPWMLRANMYSGARKVFLDEPGKIYLSDLRKSIIHLQGGGAYKDIPDNKNYLDPKDGQQQVKDGNKLPLVRAAARATLFPVKKPPPRPRSGGYPRGPGVAHVVMPFAADRLFDVDLNLVSDSSDDDDYIPRPMPEPIPDSESEPEEPTPPPTPPPPTPPPRIPTPPPPPPRTPTPPPPPPRTPTPSPPRTPPPPSPPPEPVTWLPHDPSTDEGLPPGTRVHEPCDFYIDAVRFLPDNISHCKITGRIINMYMSKAENVPDILAYPEMDGITRRPSFKYKICLNKNSKGEKQFLNPEMVIILRVYGYENHKKQICVVGSCLVSVFRNDQSPPKLHVGGRQIRIRHGLPNPPGGLEDLEPTDMDSNLVNPGVTICVRLLPASKDHVPAPSYETGYYVSEPSRPTDSEKRLYKHYVYKDDYMTSNVGDHLRKMQRLAQQPEIVNGPHLQKYLEGSLDQKEQQRITKAQIPNIDYTHYVHYDIQLGFKADVLGVFGLPVYLEGKYCQIYCEVLPGKDTKNRPPTEEGHGGYQRFITQKLDFLSSQRSPQWVDNERTLHPFYDEKAILLVQVFGFTATYKPGDGSYPGAVKDSKKGTISFSYESPMAWGVMQLFDKGSVISGVHWLPLYKGFPDPKVLNMLSSAAPAHKVMELASKKEMVKFHEGTSIEIKVWDGHMNPDDLLDGRHEEQIDGSKLSDKFIKGHKTSFPQSIDDFVLENMPERIKKDGPIGERFERERDFFQREANYVFNRAMNEALIAAGKEPLPSS